MKTVWPVLICAALVVTGCDELQRLFDRSSPPPVAANDATNPDSPAYFQTEIGDTILFPVDQSILTDEAKVVLAGQAAWLVQRPQVNVLIEGHADEQGTREYNIALGARRAASVQAYLVEMGLTDARVRTVTYGKERPLEICSTEDCWSRNRRAVTVVETGATSF